jgi:hypothetical protein
MQNQMGDMRFTIIGEDGAISFSGPGHALKALTAACSTGISTHRSLLAALKQYDAALATTVVNQLSVFDEFVTPDVPASIDRWLSSPENVSDPSVFRILDERFRGKSLKPQRLGIVIFNLPEKRIVQIENSYGPLQRTDRGRIRMNGKPVNRYYRYELPEEWSIVP